MACFHPVTAYYSKELNPTGKRSLVFNVREALEPDVPLNIACGRCIGCRLRRSAHWAGRIVAENQMHDSSCFITLTYRDEFLPEFSSLCLKDFQDFMKRLRKKFGSGIRFFHCGEYGERFCRPHYHAILFGVSFLDRELWKVRNGEKYFVSAELSALWPFGFSVIGDVTFESAAYVARYITKKVTGERALDHYTEYDTDTGEIFSERKPEYCTMSRRPGIGNSWFEKFHGDCFPWDEFVVEGRNVTVPKYFDRLMEKVDPFVFDDIKERRVARGKLAWENSTPARLLVREICKLKALDRLSRCYESDGVGIIR